MEVLVELEISVAIYGVQIVCVNVWEETFVHAYKCKKMAVSGILMAVTVLLVCFGGILESNTLFLLAGAAFCVGIIIKEYGLKTGVAFLSEV